MERKPYKKWLWLGAVVGIFTIVLGIFFAEDQLRGYIHHKPVVFYYFHLGQGFTLFYILMTLLQWLCYHFEVKLNYFLDRFHYFLNVALMAVFFYSLIDIDFDLGELISLIPEYLYFSFLVWIYFIQSLFVINVATGLFLRR